MNRIVKRRESDNMKAIFVKDMYSEPVVMEVEDKLEAKQELVGGLIEYVDVEDVSFICNEEGKLLALTPNRPLRTRQGKIYDIIFGPLLVVSQQDGVELTESQISYWLNKLSIKNTNFNLY